MTRPLTRVLPGGSASSLVCVCVVLACALPMPPSASAIADRPTYVAVRTLLPRTARVRSAPRLLSSDEAIKKKAGAKADELPSNPNPNPNLSPNH